MPMELLSVHPRDIYLVFSISLSELESLSKAGDLLLAVPMLKAADEKCITALEDFLRKAQEVVKELRTDDAPSPVKRVKL
jgi:hypothetical protein